MGAQNKKRGAKQTSGNGEAPVTRRNFLWVLWLGIGGLALLEYLAVAINFLRPGKRRMKGGGGVVVAGPLERFEPCSVTAFPQGKFYLARLSTGGFLAISRECTHLGCTVPWSADREQFVCPCHASSFDITGEVLSPPAPRALDLYAVRIENGIVKVDTDKLNKRRSFEVTQVTNP